MTTKEFISAIDNEQAKVLTLDAAKSLKGQRIAWMYFGYVGNPDIVNEMTVGEISTEFDYYKTQPCEGYSSRAAYWQSYMSSKQIAEKKERLILTDANGDNSCIFCQPNDSLYDEPTFCCSDSDREVYFIAL